MIAALRRENVRVWLLSAVVGAAALALYWTALSGDGAVYAAPRLPWWGLAILFCLAEAFPVHLHLRSETHSLSLSELALVLGLFLATPGSLVLGFACGALVALVVVRKQKPLKVGFNLAQFAFSATVAVIVFRAVINIGAAHGPLGWAAAAAGAATFGIVSVLLVATTISFIAGGPELGELPKTAAFALVGSLASASLAVAAVELVEADRRAVWLMIVPAVFWAVAFRAYGTQRRRHEHLEFLYQTMRATQGAPEFRAAVRELLSAARGMLAAEYAEIILLGATLDEAALRSVVSVSSETLMERVSLTEPTRRGIAVAATREAATLLPRARTQHEFDELLAERDLQDALVVALARDQRTFAFLVIGDRAGDVSTFDEDDRRLFETFAGHAAVLLENDQVKEQLRYQAYHDALTGLANRVLFSERVADALESDAAGTTVLFIDLDDFKTINDTLGHSAGDELLAAVAERVRACVRPADLAARLGGDEFGILIEHGSEEAAERIALRLVAALRAPFVLSGRETQVHASIGIASGSADARTGDELLANADVAMYSAKSAGKRSYAFYEARMHTRVRRRHELAAALEYAIDRDEITVHFQPIVALASGRTVACEALVRWQHPTRGLVPPGGFLSLAEQRGLMIPIGRRVLREACARTRAWQLASPRHGTLGVNVNLSPSELQSPHLTRDVADILAETGLAPESLTLEITESGAMADPVAALDALAELRRIGVRLALDDFGTGHSSLSHLREFPIDTLKLAKPFVDRLDEESGEVAFTDAILRLAAALQLTVVAEGIERVEQANVLRGLECALGQGFYFARPVAAADLERVLADTRRAAIRAA